MSRLSLVVQESLLALLCYDDERCALVAQIIPPDLFDPLHAEIAQRAVDYRIAYQEAPKDHTLDLFEDAKDESPEGGLFESLYSSLLETKDAINPSYVIDQARSFAKKQSLKRGLATALRALQKGTEEGLAEAEVLVSQCNQETVDLFDPGLEIFAEPDRTMEFLDDRWEAFSTGIPELDKRNLGPARKRLHLFIGPAKAGKSWWLMHLAKESHRRGLNVLYVTLELSQNETASRALQTTFAYSKRSVDVSYFKFAENGEKSWKNLGRTREHYERNDVRKMIGKRLEKHKTGGRVILKEFPSGQLTVPQLEAYLDMLEITKKFVPDLVLIDYIGLMTLSSTQERRHALGDLGVGLRGLAIKRSLAVATAAQANRAARTQRRRDDTSIAEDYSLIGTADTTIVYNQTDEEHEKGLARLYVAAGRSDQDKFEILISQSYAIGQFCLDSILLSSVAPDSDD